MLSKYGLEESELKMKVEDWLTQLHNNHLEQFENQARHLLKKFEQYGIERIDSIK